MFKRGDLWFMFYAVLLALSVSYFGHLSIDVQFHDIYYVVRYSSVIKWLILYLVFIAVVYFIAYRYLRLSRLLTWVHVALTILPTTYLLWITWEPQIALSGLTGRYYQHSTSGASDSMLGLAWICTFLTGQLLLIINLVWKTKLIKVSNRHRS